MSVWMTLAGLAAGHLAASFMQTALHRAFGHGVLGGWIRARHVGEHHSIYSGQRLELPAYSSEERSLTLFYLLPGCALIMLFFLLFPPAFAAGFGAGAFLSYFAHIYLHAQYHLSRPRLERHAWFRRLRALHRLHHHHQDRNFAVIDLYWDKLMGTYAGTDAVEDGTCR
jgi:sterol desaturase/sphingolipid hydroxylase (fatty acid hydroxylase superfamily)